MFGQGVVCVTTRYWRQAVQQKWIRTQPSQQNVYGHWTLRTQLYRECNASSLNVRYHSSAVEWYEDEETFRHLTLCDAST